MGMRVVEAQQGDTVDQICQRYYGRTAGITEAVLKANPRLADLGPVLPHGQKVQLPEEAEPEQTKTVQLWD
mgnify:CR=1 FL=1